MKSAAMEPERAAYHHGDLRRTLIDAGLALMAETQSWDFSLRELARRAGVSHNAPYNHFPEKRDLLLVLCGEGFEALRATTAAAVATAETAEAALFASGLSYVRFGLANPAHYRLMFGSALKGAMDRMPEAVRDAAASAKLVLENTIRWGASNGTFAVDPDDQAVIDRTVLSIWSMVHGVTMLLLDHFLGDDAEAAPEAVAASVLHLQLDGLRRR